MFLVQVDSAEQVEGVVFRMEERLKKIRGVKDFEIMTMEDYATQFIQIMDILNVALGSIASVSLPTARSPRGCSPASSGKTAASRTFAARILNLWASGIGEISARSTGLGGSRLIMRRR